MTRFGFYLASSQIRLLEVGPGSCVAGWVRHVSLLLKPRADSDNLVQSALAVECSRWLHGQGWAVVFVCDTSCVLAAMSSLQAKQSCSFSVILSKQRTVGTITMCNTKKIRALSA